MSAGPPIFIDPVTGQLRLPGRVTRTLTDPQYTSALPAWFQLTSGSLGSQVWNVAAAFPPGALWITTSATTPFGAGIKGNGNLASIAPFRLTALGITFEGLFYDADSGFGTSLGFFSAASSKGGVWIQQLASDTAASVALNDSSAVQHTFPVQYQFMANGSQGVRRRNISLYWFIHEGWVYILEDDQVVSAVDVSANIDTGDLIYPGLFITSTNSTQHQASWSQSKIIINHN